MEDQLKAIIFDVDGTLAETERDGHRVAFNLAFTDAGLDWFWDEELYGKLLAVTGGKERIRYYLSDFNKGFQYSGDIAQLVKDLHSAKTEHYVALLANKAIGLRPGVERLFSEIREAGLRMAIATTTTPENVTALIASTLGEEALSWFDCIAAGDIVPAKKPAPDIFEYCIEQLKLRPEQCLALEDSGNGIKASLGAEIPTLVTINEYTKDDDFNGALSVVTHLGEIDLPYETVSGRPMAGQFISLESLKRLHAER